jgi:4-carboxymuconolactone decarboxylase
MKERLPRLTEDQLSEDQLAVYRGITEGPRASGKQPFSLVDDTGALNGPFGVMLHAPQLGTALQELGAAIRYGTTMTDRGREIAILKVAVARQSEFEWYAHERVARSVGLTPSELAALKAGTFTSEDEVELCLSKVCDALLEDRAITDSEYASLVGIIGEKQLLEITILVGYYQTLAQMMKVFQVGAPPGE